VQRRVRRRYDDATPRLASVGVALGRRANIRRVNSAVLVESFRAEPASVRTARHAVVTFAVANTSADPNSVALAVSEAVTNAVIHAFVDLPAPGTIEVTARRAENAGLEVTVSDNGKGVAARQDSPGIGLGLPLIASVTSSFQIEHRVLGGTSLHMVFAQV
jgi:serine/threonine-protein kinase RsbW